MSEVKGVILRVLAEALSLEAAVEDLAYTEKLDEVVGLDSLAVLEFLTALEKEFGITMEPERIELEQLRDLNGLAAYVAARKQDG